MHICLPDTREVRPAHGSAYLLYNVHIDGLYHCSLRFKQLLHLHQTLSKKFNGPYHQLPPFPPKKLLPLSLNQIEDRRTQLEKYLQAITQDKIVCNSSIFNLFLLEAQRESTRIKANQVHLDIELVNGQKIRLQVWTHDSADTILTAVCRALGLDDKYHAYFCLCLCGYDVVRDKLIIKRRLSFFESPYITLQMAVQHQEQLQSVLSASNYSSPSSSNGANTNGINNRCHCQICSAKQSNSLATGVPSVGSSVGSSSGSSYINGQSQNHHMNNNSNSINHNESSGNISCTSSSNSSSNCSSNISGGININNSNGNHKINHDYNHSNGYQHQYHGAQTSCYHNNNGMTYDVRNQMIAPTSSGSTFVTHRILLRKSYWDPIYDTYILNDQQALNLLFIQTVYDIKHSLMFVNRETYHQLESLLASDSKLEYILLARTLKYYNYVHFEPCLSDYPRPRTKVMISIGSKELNMRVLKSPQAIRSSSTRAPIASTSSSAEDMLPSSSVASNGNNISSTNGNGKLSLNARTQSNHQVSVPSEQILYCTSSLLPSNYHHLITKDDLVEEEYSFKVPLIRCWRLTSLETLNSYPSIPTTQTGSSKRKNSSLLNSVLGTSNSGNNNNSCNNDGDGNHEIRHNLPHRHLIYSDTGGDSLLAALTGHIGVGAQNNHSFLHKNFNGNNFCCQRENHRCDPNPDHTQLSQYELSFEYLVSKDQLKWITISSDQAIFISISLQGVVDELVSKRDGKTSLYKANPEPPMSGHLLPTLSNSNSSNQQNFTYMYRDGSQKMLSTSNQQLIDKFGTTLGYSPMDAYSLALARQRQQIRGTSGGISTATPSARLSSGASWTSKTPTGSPQSAFEIPYYKKAPSPIINDAFEGVTNDDDL